MEYVIIIYGQSDTVFMEKWHPSNHMYALMEKILLLILPCILLPQTLYQVCMFPYKSKRCESK